MSDSEQLLAVVDSLYESALDPIQWPTAMRSLADYAGAAGTFYLVADQSRQRITYSECEGFDPRANEDYLKYYGTKDLRLVPALKFDVGREFTGEMLVDWRTFKNSELFVDLLTPHDIPRILGFWVTKGVTNASAFVFERTRRQGPFENGDVARCSRLTPHLIRAIRTREALASARERERIYVDLLNRLPFATVLLGADLSVIEASSAAQALLKHGDALRCHGGRLSAVAGHIGAQCRLSARARRRVDASAPQHGATVDYHQHRPHSVARCLRRRPSSGNATDLRPLTGAKATDQGGAGSASSDRG
jgi:hypothetical protein